MMPLFTVSEGARLCGGSYYGPDVRISRGWKCDSRDVAPGDAFVAIKGAVTDGHLYLHQAIERGAKLLLVDAAELERTEDRQQDILNNARRMAQVLEGYVAENPDQWLMFYPFWPAGGEENAPQPTDYPQPLLT